MATEIQAKVGPIQAQDGSIVDPRLTKDGATVCADGHGRYYEPTYRGNVYTTSLAAAGVTVLATHNSPLTAGTGTPLIGILNPLGSGKNLEILKATACTISGTPAGGLVWNYAYQGALITGAASGTVTPNLFVQGGANSVVKLYNNTAVTGSVVGIMFRPINQQTAIVAGFGMAPADVEVAGDIIVPPGFLLAICSSGTGTTHVVTASVTWAEWPI